MREIHSESWSQRQARYPTVRKPKTTSGFRRAGCRLQDCLWSFFAHWLTSITLSMVSPDLVTNNIFLAPDHPGKRCFRYIKHCLGKQFDKPSWLKPLGSIWPKVHSPVGEKRTVGFASCCHSRGRRSGTGRGGAYYVNKCAATPLQFGHSDGAYDVALEFRAKGTWFGEREREPISLPLWSPVLWTPGVHTWCGHTWDDNMFTDHQHCPQGPWPLVGRWSL